MKATLCPKQIHQKKVYVVSTEQVHKKQIVQNARMQNKKMQSVQNARIQKLLKMCSIFQLHEQQMHLKKIDIVHPASKVFAVGDEGHNLSELKKKNFLFPGK